MRHLFIVDKYFPKAYANAICAQSLIECLIRMGDEVDVIAFRDSGISMPSEWGGAKIYSVVPDLGLRLYYYSENFPDRLSAKPARMLAALLIRPRRLLLAPWQPFYSYSFPRRIASFVSQLHDASPYDRIVTVLNPFNGCLALYSLKKCGFPVPWSVLALDRLEDKRRQLFNGKIGDPFFWESRFLKYCDHLFYMSSRKARYEQERFTPYREKLVESDLPLIVRRNINYSPFSWDDPGAEHWCYAGTIGGKHYQPDGMLEFMLALPENPKRILHLFCKGNAGKIQEAADRSDGRIQLHGYVDRDTLESALNSADTLVSLKTSNQISAKIFDYMSFGKPIVHFSGHPDDPNAAYIRRYPLGTVIDTLHGSAPDWVSFYEKNLPVKKEHEKNFDRESLFSMFERNTPEFTCHIIRGGATS